MIEGVVDVHVAHLMPSSTGCDGRLCVHCSKITCECDGLTGRSSGSSGPASAVPRPGWRRRNEPPLIGTIVEQLVGPFRSDQRCTLPLGRFVLPVERPQKHLDLLLLVDLDVNPPPVAH